MKTILLLLFLSGCVQVSRTNEKEYDDKFHDFIIKGHRAMAASDAFYECGNVDKSKQYMKLAREIGDSVEKYYKLLHPADQ